MPGGGDSQYHITEFDIQTLPANGLVLVLGKRGTGKSTTCRYFLQQSVHAGVGAHVVICGSESVAQSWQKVVHPLFVVDITAATSYLARLIKKQNDNIRKFKGREYPPSLHVSVVLDDCVGTSSFAKCPELQYIANNGRHLNMCVYVLCQYLNQVSPEIRTNFDIIVALATANRMNITKLYNEFCSMCSARDFKYVLTAVTENRGVLVIDNRNNGMSLVDVCFYCNVPYPFDEAPLCPPAMIEFANKHYVPEGHTWGNPLSPTEDDDSTARLTESDVEDSSVGWCGRGKRSVFRDNSRVVMVRMVPTVTKKKMD